MNSTEILQELCAKGIKLSATAGEAHWQLGIVERTIQTIFGTAAKLRDSQKIPMTRAVQLAVSAHNTTERVHGYTPAQWAFGRNPSWDNTMFEEQGGTTNLARDSSESFLKKLSLQQTARSVFEQEILRQKKKNTHAVADLPTRQGIVAKTELSLHVWSLKRPSATH